MDIISLLACFRPLVSAVTLRHFSLIIPAILTMTGRITMLGISRWTAYADGYAGYMPMGASYKGNGFWVGKKNGEPDLWGEGGQLEQQQTRNPCERMAQRAQDVATASLRYGKNNNLTARQTLNSFNNVFTRYYLGRIVEDSIDALAYFKKTGGGGPPTGTYNPLEYGQEDFKEKFQDSHFLRNEPAFTGAYLDEKGQPIRKRSADKNVPQSGPHQGQWSDQVHHAVFGFSAGITTANWGTGYHNWGDWWEGNQGDVNLTNEMYYIGEELERKAGMADFRKDPRSDFFGDLKNAIMTKICGYD